MSLSRGERVGPYEVVSPLGVGGMGEVYLARDVRLARDVALKVLRHDVSSDAARLKRFENEARAASALNHPNIVTIYDVGTSGPVSFIAMERVEGSTLQQALSANPLPVRKLLPIAIQIADGLARAHEAGIVHRDLKPQNVMLTKDGRVKILDFGLAKLAPTGEAQLPAETGTFPGAVLGTVGYMSPEQARGLALDHRSDQFSFGSMLYEMATGRRAFLGKTPMDTLAAVLNAEPEPIAASNPLVPGPLCWVVERCLSKEPSQRYASTQDLAQELKVLRDHLTDPSGSAAAGGATVLRRRSRLPGIATAAALIAAAAGILIAVRGFRERPLPDFQRLTFRRGAVTSARFAPDGGTIVYSATWDRAPVRMFSTRTDGRGETRLELPDAEVASVSSLGEIAMLLDRPFGPRIPFAVTLARVPLAGGAAREMTEGVVRADWSPDGKSLAIVREVGAKYRLEYPIGKVLYETKGPITALRASPRGDRIAYFIDRPEGASVEAVDLSGHRSELSRGWRKASGLAWSPDGREVWFAVDEQAWRTPIFSVTLSGKRRMRMRLPDSVVLQDVTRDGRALVSIVRYRGSMRGVVPGNAEERDLSWREASMLRGLTPDGKSMLFQEGAEGGVSIYVRPTDGSPAKRLGEGAALAISPDGHWVAASSGGGSSNLVLLPTGAGEPRGIDTEGHRIEGASFFPDGNRLLLRSDRTYVRDLSAGKLRAVTPEGVDCPIVSPDGTEVACVGPEGNGIIYAVEGGASRPIPGFQTGEDDLYQWSSDGRSVFVGRFDATSLEIDRLDLASGRRELWRRVTPTDSLGASSDFFPFAMTPDGKSYAYSPLYQMSDLYLVTGLE